MAATMWLDVCMLKFVFIFVLCVWGHSATFYDAMTDWLEATFLDILSGHNYLSL